MTLAELQKKISEILGVSSSEKELAFEIFISKISGILTEGITLKIPRIGFFQLRKNTEKDNQPDTLIYSAPHEEIPRDSKNLFITINLPSEVKGGTEQDSDFFSIGVGKPLIPIGNTGESDSETSYAMLKKSIGERVNEIISEADQIPNFNVWDGVDEDLSLDSEKVVDSQAQLSELTADLEFKDDLIAEDITGNLLELENTSPEIDIENKNEIFPELSPTDLLEDFVAIQKEESIFIDNGQKFEQPGTNAALIEENEKEKPVEEKEIEIELGKNRKREEQKNDTVSITVFTGEKFPAEENISINKDKIENDEFGLEDIIEEKKQEDTFLGLKKKDDEAIEWNWGDELKEEFGTVHSRDNLSEQDFLDEPYRETEERISTKELFKTTKPVGSNLFSELEDTIKKEIKETEKEIQYMEYASPPPNYEFIEEDSYRSRKNETMNRYETAAYSTYEDNVYNELKNDTKERYFNKTFLIIFFAFIVITSLLVYILIPNKNVNNQAAESNAGEGSQIIQQPVGSLQQPDSDFAIVEESDFPRVASVPIKDNTDAPVVSSPPPVQRSGATNELYRNITSDTRVNKTIYHDGSSYNVQLSSWRNKIKAEEEVRRLRNRGMDAFIFTVNLPQKGGVWYRVRVGSFNSEKEADAFLAKNNF